MCWFFSRPRRDGRSDTKNGGPGLAKKTLIHLSRRERQIMDVVYRLGRVTVTDVLARLPDPPSYSAVRAMLRVLENKGHLRHALERKSHVYVPIVPRNRASRSALQNMLKTFFDGSTEKAVAALLDISRTEITDDALDRLSRLIDQSRQEGRSEEHTSELQSQSNLVCRLLLEKKKKEQSQYE